MVTISKDLFAKKIAPTLLNASKNLPADSELQKAVAQPIMYAKSQGDLLYEQKTQPKEPDLTLVDKISKVAMMENPYVPDWYPDPLGLRDKSNEYDPYLIKDTITEGAGKIVDYKMMPTNVLSLTPFMMLIEQLLNIKTPSGGFPGIWDFVKTAGNVVTTGSTTGADGSSGVTMGGSDQPQIDISMPGFNFPDLGEVPKYIGIGLLIIGIVYAFSKGSK